MVLPALVARVACTALGYAYPAYECFKAIERGASVDELRVWCTFWLVLGLWTALEPLLDVTLFWLPLYYEAKVAFSVALWHPRTRGATYLYESFVQPTLLRYEYDIDRRLEAVVSKAQRYFSDYSAMAIRWGQKRVVDLFTYVQQSQQQGRVNVGAGGGGGGVNYSQPQTAAQAATNAFGRTHQE